MKNTTTQVITGSVSYEIYEALQELIEWRLDAIQEAVAARNWEEAERLFPRVRGLGLEFLKLSYLYNTIDRKIVIAGGDHDDLALYTYSATIKDNMYDMLSENFELVLYVENQRIMPVLVLCSNRGLSRKCVFDLEKEIENNKKIFIPHERNSFFYKAPSKVADAARVVEKKLPEPDDKP